MSCVSPCWHDGTERPIHLPADPEDRQEYDRVKNKCHAIKHRLVIDETCHIDFLRAMYEGKVHEKSVVGLEGFTLPQGHLLYY